jgi:hypothetical protein
MLNVLREMNLTIFRLSQIRGLRAVVYLGRSSSASLANACHVDTCGVRLPLRMSLADAFEQPIA